MRFCPVQRKGIAVIADHTGDACVKFTGLDPVDDYLKIRAITRYKDSQHTLL
jgi:hypothetical protein